MRYLLVIAIFLPSLIKGQGIKFAKTYGQSNYSFGQALVQLPDAGYALLGSTSAIGAGNTDIIVIRTDSLGNVVWQKDIGSPQIEYAQDIVYGSDDHLYILSYTNSAVASGFDIMVTKLNMEGSIQWNELYGGNDWDFGRSMTWTSDENLVVVGETYSDSDGENDIFYFKISSVDGTVIWEKQFGTPSTEALSDIVEDLNGDLWMSGYHQNPDSNAYLIKSNSLGDTLFTISIGDSNPQVSSGLDIYENGDVLILFDNYFGSTPDSIKLGFWKLENNGIQIWSRDINEDPKSRNGVDILSLKDNRIIISSNFNLGQVNGMWWPYNEDGYFISQSSTTEYGSFELDIFSNTIHTSDCGIAHIGTTESWGSGFSNIWFVKHDSVFSSMEIPDEEVLTSSPEFDNNPIRVFPNPATSYIQITNINSSIALNYILVDRLGRIIKTENYNGRINIEELKNGFYQVLLFNDSSNMMSVSFVKF